MKAIVKHESGPGLRLKEVPMPEYGVNDVLIKILKTSICGTDVHIYDWDEWARKTISTPCVIGHEFVGRVENIGANVHDVKIGDLVSGEGHLVCGRCRNCRAGRRHLCPNTQGIGVNRDGAFAEYLALPVTNIWHCSKKLPLELLSCFDPLGNATHTALSFPVLGEDVLVTGAGPIGIMAAAIAKHAGARHVVITDIIEARLKLAAKFNLAKTVNVRHENLAEVQKQLDMKEGFDVGLEMSGSPQAFNSMLENMCHGGKIAMLGIPPANTAADWQKIVFNGLTIKGIYGREMYETWYLMTSMLESGLHIAPIITHRFNYREFELGFQAMKSGNSGKVILDWQE
ncbi:MAG: L-threonine 3-dehydrogenase [Lentisphaeria bacterium]|jgi:threonine 3-dehydrogenase|nr:L-threonine 3-dehydrogenase [Lentisphaeria bacterium]NLZ59933.1 L-threonine 3-dehydrogenase [Lentisphaerota bacterium]